MAFQRWLVPSPEVRCTDHQAHGNGIPGWQHSQFHTDTGLTPGTSYTYTVLARDKSPAQNATAASART